MNTDVVVIGGGIAGVSAAAALAERGRSVVLVESEPHLAYHTTGRSAALYFENYGHPAVRPLTRASRDFFESPPESVMVPLLSPRGALTVAPAERLHVLEELATEATRHDPVNTIVDGADARRMVPTLRPEAAAAALWEPGCRDIDVAGLHQGFVRKARNGGAELRTSHRVLRLESTGGRWRVTAGGTTIDTAVVVNAAGAWCDAVAMLGGVEPIGLVPKRRTAFMVTAPPDAAQWPFVVDADQTYYFKPDGPQLLCSPSDATPSEPCDARPAELDVAIAIERINLATNLGIRSVRSSWAGLRSFVDDGAMVIGFDPDVAGFFWLAGQGGTGIQTSPAAAALTADLICDGTPSVRLRDFGVDATALSPRRLRTRRSDD